MANIGSLQVDLRLATAKFEQGMARANKSLTTLERSTRTLSRGMQGLLAIGAAGLFGNMVGNSLAAADALAKSSARLGVNAERLQELQFAASQSGVGVATLEMALQRFGRRLGEAAKGTGEAKDALKQLGIATTNADGSVRDVNAAFTEAINKLGQMENAAERNALAMKLFDSEGVRLVQFGNNLDNLTKKSRDLGLVIDGELLKNAEKTNDQFDVLSRTLNAQFTTALVKASPYITAVGDALLEVVNRYDQLFQRFRDSENLVGDIAIGNRLNDLLSEQIRVENRLQQAQAAANLGGELGKAANSEEISRLKARLEQLNEIIPMLRGKMDRQTQTVEQSTEAVKNFTEAVKQSTSGHSELYKKLFGDPNKKKGRQVESHQFNNYARAAMARLNEGNAEEFSKMMERARDVFTRSARSDLNFDVKGMRDVITRLSDMGKFLPASTKQGSGSLTIGGKTYGPQKPVASFEFVIDGTKVAFQGNQDDAAAFSKKMTAALRGEASALTVSKL